MTEILNPSTVIFHFEKKKRLIIYKIDIIYLSSMLIFWFHCKCVLLHSTKITIFFFFDEWIRHFINIIHTHTHARILTKNTTKLLGYNEYWRFHVSVKTLVSTMFEVLLHYYIGMITNYVAYCTWWRKLVSY